MHPCFCVNPEEAEWGGRLGKVGEGKDRWRREGTARLIICLSLHRLVDIGLGARFSDRYCNRRPPPKETTPKKYRHPLVEGLMVAAPLLECARHVYGGHAPRVSWCVACWVPRYQRRTQGSKFLRNSQVLSGGILSRRHRIPAGVHLHAVVHFCESRNGAFSVCAGNDGRKRLEVWYFFPHPLLWVQLQPHKVIPAVRAEQAPFRGKQCDEHNTRRWTWQKVRSLGQVPVITQFTSDVPCTAYFKPALWCSTKGPHRTWDARHLALSFRCHKSDINAAFLISEPANLLELKIRYA